MEEEYKATLVETLDKLNKNITTLFKTLDTLDEANQLQSTINDQLIKQIMRLTKRVKKLETVAKQ